MSEPLVQNGTSEGNSGRRISDVAVAHCGFLNFYLCPADETHWTDAWPHMSDDRCPRCGREIEPYKSIDL